MNLTSYHAKFFTRSYKTASSNDIGKFTVSLQDAQVDLNPHQVEADLIAFSFPLSNGAILADEVGLGKTIEALLTDVEKMLNQKCLITRCSRFRWKVI